MSTQSDPIVNFCEALFNGRSLFTSPIVRPNYTKPQINKPPLADWCWAILNIQQISETAFGGNQIKHVLAVQTIQQFDATISQLKQNPIFADCNEQQIINTVQKLAKRLGITEELKSYARGLIIDSNT